MVSYRKRVSTDVREVSAQWLRSRIGVQPEAIVAGFPCIGFSLVGKRQGFAHEESALFNEVLKLTDELRGIKFLFLENVPHILHTVIFKELHVRRHCAWPGAWFMLMMLGRHKCASDGSASPSVASCPSPCHSTQVGTRPMTGSGISTISAVPRAP